MWRITSQSIDTWAGKTIAHITRNAGLRSDDLVMCTNVVITFTDETTLELAIDYRGDASYISQITSEEPMPEPPPLVGDDIAIWKVLEGAQNG